MKITDIDVDGFGVWNNLKLSNLSRRVTAFYGPNEAGKSTVMHFVRTILYGVTPWRRARYLPPVEGGRPGGALGIVEGDLAFRVARYAERGPEDVGRVTCTTPDGVTGGDRLLAEALGDVDEQTFTNIFAVTLSEVQELGALSGSRAAEWLYRLTSGIDRISLHDVMINLRAQRAALLSAPGGPSRIVELTEGRDGRTDLKLRLHERVVSFGRFLTDEERRDLAETLSGALADEQSRLLERLADGGERQRPGAAHARPALHVDEQALGVGRLEVVGDRHVSVRLVDAPARKDVLARHEDLRVAAPAHKDARLAARAVDQDQCGGVTRAHARFGDGSRLLRRRFARVHGPPRLRSHSRFSARARGSKPCM